MKNISLTPHHQLWKEKMKNDFDQWLEDRKNWERRRDSIKKNNEKLISYWRSIPWWRFWEKPSFETQRSIILSNWGQLEATEEKK